MFGDRILSTYAKNFICAISCSFHACFRIVHWRGLFDVIWCRATILLFYVYVWCCCCHRTWSCVIVLMPFPLLCNVAILSPCNADLWVLCWFFIPYCRGRVLPSTEALALMLLLDDWVSHYCRIPFILDAKSYAYAYDYYGILVWWHFLCSIVLHCVPEVICPLFLFWHTCRLFKAQVKVISINTTLDYSRTDGRKLRYISWPTGETAITTRFESHICGPTAEKRGLGNFNISTI